MSSPSLWKKIGISAAITGGVLAGVSFLPVTLGFGTAGIIGGSIAAGIQAAIGNVAATAVGSILGIGGIAAYLKGKFSAKEDAELISKTIENNDNPDIIIKLLESRSQFEIEEIRKEYNKLGENKNFDRDIINYLKKFGRKKGKYAIAICYKPDFEHTYENVILIPEI